MESLKKSSKRSSVQVGTRGRHRPTPLTPMPLVLVRKWVRLPAPTRQRRASWPSTTPNGATGLGRAAARGEEPREAAQDRGGAHSSIEAAEKLKQDKALQRVLEAKKEEDERVAVEEEKARQKEERKRRLEESAAVRKLEEEVLEGQKKATKAARAQRKDENSQAKVMEERKARAMRQAKREEAMERAQAIKKDEEERRKEPAEGT